MDLELLIEPFVNAGYSDIMNFPTVGIYTSYCKIRNSVGLGFSRETNMIK
jgi:predicted TIM-barrel enzyme